jgi:hypothetical protein
MKKKERERLDSVLTDDIIPFLDEEKEKKARRGMGDAG